MFKIMTKPVIIDNEVYDRVFYKTGPSITNIIEALQDISATYKSSLGILRYNDVMFSPRDSAGAITGITIDVSRKGHGGFAMLRGSNYSFREDK